MNFYDAQDRARRSTRWLVLLYLVATIVIVAAVTALVGGVLYTTGTPRAPEPAVLGTVAALATLLIVGSSVYKTAALSAGGGRVAQDMGGTLVPPDVQGPLRKRLRNVIEEMSIASGVPVPEIYVLEAEPGINAFAAGYSPGDAAIAVTRGALEILDRDELQGVIAHEFSHILNGDMRLSIRMMGVLFGIMVIGLIGRLVLRGAFHGRAIPGRRNRNSGGILAIGLGLAILGWIGVFLARLIKAAISRRRESLADASAVQFTRQTEGLASALKKIGGFTEKSYIRAVDPEEVSHMLFSFGTPRLMSLFATHPPLAERIRALDPSFRETDYPEVRPGEQSVAPAEFTGRAFAPPAPGMAPSGSAAGWDAGQVADRMGQPNAEQLAFARSLRESLPEDLAEAAHSPGLAILLALALALDRSGAGVERQLRFLAEQLGAERVALIRKYHAMLVDLGPAWNLPLLDLSFPALKRRPLQQLEFLRDLVRRVIEIDGAIDLYEYCFYEVLAANLQRAVDPARRPGQRRATKSAARRAAIALVRIVANQGHADDASRDQAFRAGIAAFGPWAERVPVPDVTHATAELGRCLDVLRQIDYAGRQRVVRAIVAAILDDRQIKLAEAELLRAICASLGCPLPPLVTSALPAP